MRQKPSLRVRLGDALARLAYVVSGRHWYRGEIDGQDQWVRRGRVRFTDEERFRAFLSRLDQFAGGEVRIMEPRPPNTAPGDREAIVSALLVGPRVEYLLIYFPERDHATFLTAIAFYLRPWGGASGPVLVQPAPDVERGLVGDLQTEIDRHTSPMSRREANRPSASLVSPLGARTAREQEHLAQVSRRSAVIGALVGAAAALVSAGVVALVQAVL